MNPYELLCLATSKHPDPCACSVCDALAQIEKKPQVQMLLEGKLELTPSGYVLKEPFQDWDGAPKDTTASKG